MTIYDARCLYIVIFFAHTALIQEDHSAPCITCQLCTFVYGRVCCLRTVYIHDAPVHCEWSGALDTTVNDVHFNFSDNAGTMPSLSPANTPSSGPQHGMYVGQSLGLWSTQSKISSCHVCLLYVCTFPADDTFIPVGVGIGMLLLLLLVMLIVVVIVIVVGVKRRAARNQKRKMKIRGNLHYNNTVVLKRSRHGSEKVMCK